jgi:hypothetical protein
LGRNRLTLLAEQLVTVLNHRFDCDPAAFRDCNRHRFNRLKRTLLCGLLIIPASLEGIA